jgi:hypothetical protein
VSDHASRVKRARELDAAASKGPWAWDPDDPSVLVDATGTFGMSDADAYFIAESRTLLVELADDVERLAADNAQLRSENAQLRVALETDDSNWLTAARRAILEADRGER